MRGSIISLFPLFPPVQMYVLTFLDQTCLLADIRVLGVRCYRE
jgi:hypothetical protein